MFYAFLYVVFGILVGILVTKKLNHFRLDVDDKFLIGMSVILWPFLSIFYNYTPWGNSKQYNGMDCDLAPI